MSVNKSIKNLELTAAGGIIDIPSLPAFEILRVTGNDTMSSSYSITSTNAAYKVGYVIQTFYEATMNFDGNDLNIFGKVIPPNYQALRWVMWSFYNGVSWDSFLTIDPTISGSIPALQVLASNEPEGDIIIGQGAGLASHVLSGDVTMDKLGAVSIGAGKVTPEMLNFGLDSVIVGYEKTLTNGQLLTLNATPIEILADSGVPAGWFVSVVTIAFSYKYDSASLVLADDFQLQYNDGSAIADIPQANLIAANDKIWTQPVVLDYDAIADRGVRIAAKSSDPTGGGVLTTLKVRVYYTLTAV